MNKDLIIENFVESAYEVAKDYQTILFEGFINELDEDDIEVLNGFHPNEVMRVLKNDEYYCGSRANTFIVMFGWDEYSQFEKTILIQSNHKGLMHFTMFPY